MELNESPVFREYAKTPKEGVYEFYSCYKCGRLFTREEEVAAFKRAELAPTERDACICKCGSKKYSPAFPKRFQWLRFNVMVFTGKLVLARGLAPWLEKRMPKALPLVEYLVRYKEA